MSGEFGDPVECAVWLAYSNTGADVGDDLGQDCFVGGLQDKELWKWAHQARPQTFAEAHAAALQREACFRREEDQRVVRLVSQRPPETSMGGLEGAPPRLMQVLERILLQLEGPRAASKPW